MDREIVIVKKIMSDEEINKKAGHFFDEDHYHTIFDRDVDVFTDDGRFVLLLRKKIIPPEESQRGIDSFLEHATRTSSTNRGAAAGLVDINKFSKNVVELLDEGNVKSRMRFKDGRVTNYRYSNRSNSCVAGYLNRNPLNEKVQDKVPDGEKGRLTAYSKKYPKEWQNFVPLVTLIDKLFANIYPDRYFQQKQQLSSCEYLINSTVFTTVTINYNFRTACHKDKGNVKDSISAFLVCENSDSNWSGGYLGFPQFGIAVNVREQDFVLMNPHLYHCNTQFIAESSFTRLSFVFYARQRLL